MQKNTNVFLLVVALLLIVVPLVATHTTQNNSLAAVSGLTTTTLQRGALHLFDGNNQDLGLLIQANRPASVFITYLQNQNVLLEIRNNSDTSNHAPFIVTSNSNIYYSGPDCTGTPYSGEGSPSASVVTFVGNRLFRFTNGSSNNHFLSTLIGDPGNGHGCVNGQAPVTSLSPLEEIPMPISLPLAWPLRVGYPTISTASEVQ